LKINSKAAPVSVCPQVTNWKVMHVFHWIFSMVCVNGWRQTVVYCKFKLTPTALPISLHGKE
jgi:hypothetical protein